MAFKINESRAFQLSKEIDASHQQHLHTAYDGEPPYPIHISSDRIKQIGFHSKSRSMYSRH